MARFIIGGYQRDFNINVQDDMCRAIQYVVLTQLSKGEGLFFRSHGQVDGDDLQSAVWINPSSAIRFEYDSEIFPDVNGDLADSLQKHVDQFGGIVIPSKAEMDLMHLEDSVAE